MLQQVRRVIETALVPGMRSVWGTLLLPAWSDGMLCYRRVLLRLAGCQGSMHIPLGRSRFRYVMARAFPGGRGRERGVPVECVEGAVEGAKCVCRRVWAFGLGRVAGYYLVFADGGCTRAAWERERASGRRAASRAEMPDGGGRGETAEPEQSDKSQRAGSVGKQRERWTGRPGLRGCRKGRKQDSSPSSSAGHRAGPGRAGQGGIWPRAGWHCGATLLLLSCLPRGGRWPRVLGACAGGAGQGLVVLVSTGVGSGTGRLGDREPTTWVRVLCKLSRTDCSIAASRSESRCEWRRA